MNMYTAMAFAVGESFMMPKPEILTFNGDRVMYYKFIGCFETKFRMKYQIVAYNCASVTLSSTVLVRQKYNNTI